MNKYRFHFKTLKTKKKKTKKTKGFPIKIARGLQRERNRELCELFRMLGSKKVIFC